MRRNALACECKVCGDGIEPYAGFGVRWDRDDDWDWGVHAGCVDGWVEMNPPEESGVAPEPELSNTEPAPVRTAPVPSKPPAKRQCPECGDTDFPLRYHIMAESKTCNTERARDLCDEIDRERDEAFIAKHGHPPGNVSVPSKASESPRKVSCPTCGVHLARTKLALHQHIFSEDARPDGFPCKTAEGEVLFNQLKAEEGFHPTNHAYLDDDNLIVDGEDDAT